MRRLAILIAAGSMSVMAAAEHGAERVTLWKAVNFALLAGGLGYLLHKKGGAFFGGRTEQIQKGIAEAARIKTDAEARYAEMERRLEGLAAEIESLRKTAREESAAEGERVRQETGRELRKIQEQAGQEIAAAARAARQELQAHAAELAVRLAEQKIRQRMTPEIENQLVAATVRELERAGRVS